MQPFSDEDASIETMSHCSGFSDPASFTEDGKFFNFYLPPLLLGYFLRELKSLETKNQGTLQKNSVTGEVGEFEME